MIRCCCFNEFIRHGGFVLCTDAGIDLYISRFVDLTLHVCDQDWPRRKSRGKIVQNEVERRPSLYLLRGYVFVDLIIEQVRVECVCIRCIRLLYIDYSCNKQRKLLVINCCSIQRLILILYERKYSLLEVVDQEKGLDKVQI